MMEDLKDWTKRELSKCLSYQVEDTVVTNLLSLTTRDDIEEYATDLLGSKAVDFVRQYLLLWSAHCSHVPMIAHRKQPEENLVLYADKKKQRSKDKRNRGLAHPPGLSQTATTHPKPASKTKYVSLMSSEGQCKAVVQLPGRHACDCLAQKHSLVNNCLECGRIICDQEGAGLCLFCGNLVLTKEEEKLLTRDSKRADKLKEKLWDKYNVSESIKPVRTSEGFTTATEHRDKLLEFDRTSAKRTQVIDDESDYFTVHSQWLSHDEKQALQEREDKLKLQMHSRSDRKFTLDFAGRKVIEEDVASDIYSEDSVKDIVSGQHDTVRRITTKPDLPTPNLTYLSTTADKKKHVIESITGFAISRVQDKQLLEMGDQGYCLSLHQPWASLLVQGIKRYEGRTWYTQHRGKLWIAATAQQPQYADIKAVEESCINDSNLPFPAQYSTSCVLGCVDLVDCLPQEEFKEKYPEGDSDSPYVFVCKNPLPLRVKYPIKGKHKIWKLPREVHNIVKKTVLS